MRIRTEGLDLAYSSEVGRGGKRGMELSPETPTVYGRHVNVLGLRPP